MNIANLIKSLRICLYFSLIITCISCNNETIEELRFKDKGYIEIEDNYSKLSDIDSLYIYLNGTQSVDELNCSEFKDSLVLSWIPTTLIPNKDGRSYQIAWKVPKEFSPAFNYYKFSQPQKNDSFFVPAFKEENLFLNGFPALFIYVEEKDFFSDSTGIFIPGIHADKNDIKRKGNYAMRGKEWERKVYFQLFDSESELVDDGWAGARVHGNLTRAAPQKSLRFYARPKYKKQSFKTLFGNEDHVSRFLLRTPFASNRELIYKDVLSSKVALEMGMDAMRSTPVNVYINGEYWGYYNYRDRVDEHFFFEKYGIDTLDFVDLYSQPKYGSVYDFEVLRKWIAENDLRLDENFDQLKNKIDIENYARYLLLEFFFANKDWPHNNVRLWKSSSLDNKWRWLVFDLDATGKNGVDMLGHMRDRANRQSKFWASNLMLGALANEDFYQLLKSEYERLSANEMALSRLQKKADSLSTLYQPFLENQIKRWHFPQSLDHFTTIHQNYLDFLEERSDKLNLELDSLHFLGIEYQEKLFTKP